MTLRDVTHKKASRLLDLFLSYELLIWSNKGTPGSEVKCLRLISDSILTSPEPNHDCVRQNLSKVKVILPSAAGKLVQLNRDQ